MNLITYNYSGPILGHDDKYQTNIESRRDAIVADLFSLGWERQLKFKGQGWRATTYYSYIGIKKQFKFGYEELYYDGNHKVLWVGPFYLAWC